MSEDKDILFKIKIFGKDYTKISDCLEDCSIEYMYGGMPDKSTHDEHIKLLLNLADTLYWGFSTKHQKSEEVKIQQKNFWGLSRKEGVQKENGKKSTPNVQEKVEEKLKKNKIKELSEELGKRLKSLEDRYNQMEEINDDDSDLNGKIVELKSVKEKLNNDYVQLTGNGEKELLEPSREQLQRLLEDADLVDKLVSEFEGKSWTKAVEDKLINHPLFLIYDRFAKDVDLMENDELIVGRRKEREIELKERDCKLCTFFNSAYLFGNLVGTISKEYTCREFAEQYRDILGEEICKQLNETIYSDKKIVIVVQIRSRLDGQSKKPFFLLEMLTQGNISFSDSSKVPSSDEDAAIFDCLLLWLLKQYLMKAYGKGVYRTYQTFQKNDTKLRGSIDFATHIKKNMGLHNGNIAYTYREKSADNYINHLILEAYEELKNKYYDLVVSNFDNKYEVKEVINLLKSQTEYPKYKRATLMNKCEAPIAHPYYTEYEDLRQVCMRVLRGEGASIMSNSGAAVSGILYYIPDLWEEYLESKMQDMNLSLQDVIHVFHNGETYKNIFRPDFVFRTSNNQPFMILDAKYKPAWKDIHIRGTLGNYKGDYEECIRNMNAINAYATGVIFPYMDGEKLDKQQEENKVDETRSIEKLEDKVDETISKNEHDAIFMHAISEYNQYTSFYTIPICVPQPEDKKTNVSVFEKWQNALNKSIDAKIKKMKEIIAIEEKKFELLDAALKSVDLNEYKQKRIEEDRCIVLDS